MYFDWLEQRIQEAQKTFAELRLEITITLRNPASLVEIAEGEKLLDIPFATSHRAFLERTNGMVINYLSVCDLGEVGFGKVGAQLRICSIDESIVLRDSQKSWQDEDAIRENSPQDFWRHLTVCCDCEDGNLIVLDPENCSADGEYRALNAFHEMPPRIWRQDLVIADSFESWLSRCFDSMIENREYPTYWNNWPLLPSGAEKYDWTQINDAPR